MTGVGGSGGSSCGPSLSGGSKRAILCLDALCSTLCRIFTYAIIIVLPEPVTSSKTN